MISPSPIYTDTHAHLASARFREDLEGVITRASAAGVRRIVSISCDIEDVAFNLALAGSRPGLFATAGVHPCYVHEIGEGDWLGEMRSLATLPGIVAIGEIGLDYYHPPQDGGDVTAWRAAQRRVFESLLQLARDLGKPVVVHQRESGPDVLEVLANFPEVTAVLHCFTGGPEEAGKALAAGHFLSFTGVLTYPKAPEVRESAKITPLDRIMIETDAPYLAPVPHRGKRCEPAMVVDTAGCLAELHGVSAEEMAEITTANAGRFFGLHGEIPLPPASDPTLASVSFPCF